MDPIKPGFKTSEAHSAGLAMVMAFAAGNLDLGQAFNAALALCPPLVQVIVPAVMKLAGAILPAIIAHLYGRERRVLKSYALQAECKNNGKEE